MSTIEILAIVIGVYFVAGSPLIWFFMLRFTCPIWLRIVFSLTWPIWIPAARRYFSP